MTVNTEEVRRWGSRGAGATASQILTDKLTISKRGPGGQIITTNCPHPRIFRPFYGLAATTEANKLRRDIHLKVPADTPLTFTPCHKGFQA